MTELLTPGSVHLADLGSGHEGEQAGIRPVILISHPDHIELVTRLITVVPCTTRDRGWPNNPIMTGPTGLSRPTVALTEQVRTIGRTRLLRRLGHVDDDCLVDVMGWVRDWLV